MEVLTKSHGVRATHVVAILLDLVGIVGDPVEAAKTQGEGVLKSRASVSGWRDGKTCQYAYVVAPPDATVVATAHAATGSRTRTLDRLTRYSLEVGDAAEGVAQSAGGEAPALDIARVGVALVTRSLADAGGGLEVQTRPLVGGVVVGHVVEDLLDGTSEQVVGDVRGSLESPGDLLNGVGLVDTSSVGCIKSTVGGDELWGSG